MWRRDVEGPDDEKRRPDPKSGIDGDKRAPSADAAANGRAANADAAPAPRRTMAKPPLHADRPIADPSSEARPRPPAPVAAPTPRRPATSTRAQPARTTAPPLRPQSAAAQPGAAQPGDARWEDAAAPENDEAVTVAPSGRRRAVIANAARAGLRAGARASAKLEAAAGQAARRAGGAAATAAKVGASAAGRGAARAASETAQTLQVVARGVTPVEAVYTSAATVLVLSLIAGWPMLAALLLIAAGVVFFSLQLVLLLAERAEAPLRPALDAAAIGARRAASNLWLALSTFVEIALTAFASLGLGGARLVATPAIDRAIPPTARLDPLARGAYAPGLLTQAALLVLVGAAALVGVETRVAWIDQALVASLHAAPFLMLLAALLRPTRRARIAAAGLRASIGARIAAAVCALGAVLLLNLDAERRLVGGLDSLTAELAQRGADLVGGPSVFSLAQTAAHSMFVSGLRPHEIAPEVWVGLHLWTSLLLVIAVGVATALTIYRGPRADLATASLGRAVGGAGLRLDALRLLARGDQAIAPTRIARATVALAEADAEPVGRADAIEAYWVEIGAAAEAAFGARFEQRPTLYAAAAADAAAAALPPLRDPQAALAYRRSWLAKIQAYEPDASLLFIATLAGVLGGGEELAARASRRTDPNQPIRTVADALAALIDADRERSYGLIDAAMIGGVLRGLSNDPIESVNWADQTLARERYEADRIEADPGGWALRIAARAAAVAVTAAADRGRRGDGPPHPRASDIRATLDRHIDKTAALSAQVDDPAIALFVGRALRLIDRYADQREGTEALGEARASLRRLDALSAPSRRVLGV